MIPAEFVKTARAWTPLLAVGLALAACNTTKRQLELERAQLTDIRVSATETRDLAQTGEFDRAKYDLYLMLHRTIFDQVMAAFDGREIAVGSSSRPIDVIVNSVRMKFLAGYPDIAIDATAVDRKSGVRADLVLDARMMIEGDPEQPDSLAIRPRATRIVPKLSWGVFDFTRRRFVRDLLALKAAEFTEKLPRITLPVTKDFSVGSPARVETTRFAIGGSAWMEGRVSYPAIQSKGRVAVKRILFLENGVHMFANVEESQ
jgi:hypothetical protein